MQGKNQYLRSIPIKDLDLEYLEKNNIFITKKILACRDMYDKGTEREIRVIDEREKLIELLKMLIGNNSEKVGHLSKIRVNLYRDQVIEENRSILSLDDVENYIFINAKLINEIISSFTFKFKDNSGKNIIVFYNRWNGIFSWFRYGSAEDDLRLSKNKNLYISGLKDFKYVDRLIDSLYPKEDVIAVKEKLLKEFDKTEGLGVIINITKNSNSKLLQFKSVNGFKIDPGQISLEEIANFMSSEDVIEISFPNTLYYNKYKIYLLKNNITKLRLSRDRLYYGRSSFEFWVFEEFRKLIKDTLQDVVEKNGLGDDDDVNQWLLGIILGD